GVDVFVVSTTHFDGGRILNIPVPQTGHTPFKAGRPFAIFTCCALEILRLALHFTQYPSSAAIGLFPPFAIWLLRSGAGGGRNGDNIIPPAYAVGAGSAGWAGRVSQNPIRL